MSDPLAIIRETDPGLISAIDSDREMVLGDGALSAKTKLLIAMALDAAKGAEHGVRWLAMQAKQRGATDEELLEAVRVAYFIAGVGSVYTAANGLRDVIA